MATLFAPFKVLALSVAAIILALTPLSSLVFWVEGSSEVIYSSPDFTVIYRSNVLNAITGSNETRVKIEVKDESGKPLEFAAFLSGPTSEGAVNFGNVSGKGYAVKAIGRYVSEVKRVLRDINSDPETSGLGMLILISIIIEENGEYYAAADAISAPIIPGKAVGKDIVVTVKFKPIMKYKVKGSGGSEGQQNLPVEVTKPPSTITHSCVGPSANICYVWRLVEVLYNTPTRVIDGVRVSWDYIPVYITNSTSPHLIDKTDSIIHSFTITLTQASVKYIAFTMSLGWSTKSGISVYVPGDSYVKEIEKTVTEEKLYKISCWICSTLISDQSMCNYLVSKDGREVGYETSKFTGDVLFSTGFMGKLWLVRYEYVRVEAGLVKEVLNDKVLAVWMAPFFNDNGVIVAGWEVDDNPNDNQGVTEKVLKLIREKLYDVLVGQVESSQHYSLDVRSIYVDSKASQWFGVGIAIGALILTLAGITEPWIIVIAGLLSIGLNAGSVTQTLYYAMGTFMILLTSTSKISCYYAKFTNTYMVKGESTDKPVPLMIFKPK